MEGSEERAVSLETEIHLTVAATLAAIIAVLLKHGLTTHDDFKEIKDAALADCMAIAERFGAPKN